MSKKNTVTYHSAEQFELAAMVPVLSHRKTMEYTAALDVKQTFKLQRDEDGKVIKDGNGKALLAVDKTGNPILTSLTIVPKPSESDKRDDMSDAAKATTGKAVVGQALMEFERAAQRELFEQMMDRMRVAFDSEQHVPVGYRIDVRTGRETFAIKPLVKPPQMTRAEVKLLAEQNGYKVIDVESTVVKHSEPAKPLTKKQQAAIEAAKAKLAELEKQSAE